MEAVTFLQHLRAWSQKHDAATPFTIEERALSDVLSRVPVQADSYYAECRLKDDARLDYLVAFHRRGPSIAALSDYSSNSLLGEVGAFLHLWAARRSALEVRTLWLEFDDVFRNGASVIPSLSALVLPNYGASYVPPSSANRPADVARLLPMLDDLTCGTTTGVERECLRRCVMALQESSEIIHLSVMHGRMPRSIKIYTVMPREALLCYLHALEWPGCPEQLEALLGCIATKELCGPRIYCDLNLASVHDRDAWTLGIAFSQQQAQIDAPDDRERTRLMSRLVGASMCSESMANALRAWSGANDGSWTSPACQRWLDVKSVIHARGDIQTKAYLGMRTHR